MAELTRGWAADSALKDPIRAELFGAERLEQHAASLAAAQAITRSADRRSPLLERVRNNRRVLREMQARIAEAVSAEEWITPAAEWLIDNFHIVDEQLREIRDDLPEGYYRELPKLADGPHRTLPRVYGMAWAFVAHTDSRFAPDLLRRFVDAYQRVDPLTIGELWAIAITLRVVLVENLRRCAEAIARGMEERLKADQLADELLGSGRDEQSPSQDALDRYANQPLTRAFAVELVLRLRDRDPNSTPALAWLNRRLASLGTTADDLVDFDHQRQAAMTVTVRNIITSMRLMSSFDWSEFVEQVSLVDRVLRESPTYGEMDFASRDAYRHAVEDISRGSRLSEIDVATAAIARARAGTGPGSDGRTADPGYYLIGRGRRTFERTLGFRPTFMRRVYRAYVDAAIPGYLGSIAILTGAILALPLSIAHLAGLGLDGAIVLGLLALVPASDLAIAVVNRSVTAIVPPALLPRLRLRDGVPQSLRTLVVVPTLLTSVEEIVADVERLEVHYLANPDDEVLFAVLSDWTDADTERVAGDDELLDAAVAAIASLNQRHPPGGGGIARFRLLHRARRWNPFERKWMGWERKRGKLHELNRLLRGATDTTYLNVGGVPPDVPPGVRYVMTLDSDTRIPIGAVTSLVGTMYHPLNRPRFDERTGRVVDGHAIMQPRVTPPLPGRAGSIYQQIMSGPSGIDPYASAVSDVYQDIFGEGSFTGKGIYDVDAFEAALEGRVPENRLLSHDLYEGIFARAALITDIEVFEQVPASYTVGAARQHRWVRGDWQLLPWLFARDLPAVARWKMLDNLRRSLSAPASLLTIVVAWLVPGASPLTWLAFILATIGIPTLIPVFAGVIPRGRGISKRSHVRAVRRDVELAGWQFAITVTMLAHQAWIMADAIVRTLVRVLVTRRNLLEWTTAAQSAQAHRPSLAHFAGRMIGAVVLAAVAAALISIHGPAGWPMAIPLLMLWVASPVIAQAISISQLTARTTAVAPDDARSLRLVARRTWRFFEAFVGPADSWLPPDNFQELPEPVVARRTSPTNIGLTLLSTVSARDFGWIGMHDMVDRLEATLSSAARLERHRGHWYNWYDTADGRTLEPRYISSVDSGNLAGALIGLGNTCRDLLQRPLLSAMPAIGVDDATQLVRRAVRRLPVDAAHGSTARRKVEDALAAIPGHPETAPQSAFDLARHLESVTAAARVMRDIVSEAYDGDDGDEVSSWLDALAADSVSHQRDLDALVPWARQSVPPEMALRHLDAFEVPLADLPERYTSMASSVDSPEMRVALTDAAANAERLVTRLRSIANDAARFVEEMEFGFLFDRTRKLFSIGYRVADDALDPGWYDLLASEARLMSYIAIAKGDVPVEHWFRLGRSLTPVGRDSVLLSWSGSMFEYLMPALLMRTPVGSLLEQTCRLVVQRQIAYGSERNVPWGVSESGYNARDLEMTYKYSAFGVPGLGLKRGLGDAIVITPHATGLATMIDPAAAVRNFSELQRAGALGRYGFYEAIDYTASRRRPGTRGTVVHSYMAHHQGMMLVAITNALYDGVVRGRFHAEPMVQATELLLQERTPRDIPVARPRTEPIVAVGDVREPTPAISRTFHTPHDVTPRTHLLSNGRYAVMITASGAGYSRWSGLAVTRWREDVTLDETGSFLFVRDVASGESWSAGFQPLGVTPAAFEVSFREDRAEFVRRDGSIVTRLEVIVSGEDDAELRFVSLTNGGATAREFDVTSYAEVVLAPQAADVAHPAFSNLFVHTEAIPQGNGVLATRRQRAPGEAEVWLGHVVAAAGKPTVPVQWETDRFRFIGRGNTLRTARGAVGHTPMSNTEGAVLDPVVSLRRRVQVPAGRTVRLCFSTFVGRSRELMLNLADKYCELTIFERAATLAWTRAQVQMHHVGIGPNEAHLFQELAGLALFPDRAARAKPGVLLRQRGGAQMLWPHGISGDLPIVLVIIEAADDIGIVRQLLRAHEYWRLKRLAVDLVILNDRAPSYVQDLQLSLQSLIRTAPAPAADPAAPVRGAAFLLRAEQLTAEQRDVLLAAARVVLSARHGALAEQLARIRRAVPTAARPALPQLRPPRAPVARPEAIPLPPIEFGNGYGGFTADGREYVIGGEPPPTTPLPWINVIANDSFGALVSERGVGCSWAHNSQSNRLTPWSNDPVSDPPSEALYLRDEDSGVTWSATPHPVRDPQAAWLTRHGAGYTRFEGHAHELRSDLLVFVAPDDPVKIARLVVTNQSATARRISVTAFADWVLGSARADTSPHIVTSIDETTGALLAMNSWNADYSGHVAFADLRGRQESVTADRAEFVGRNGTLANPEALRTFRPLSGHAGAGRDPCAALQQHVVVPPTGAAEVVFILGQAESSAAVVDLIQRYRVADLDAVKRQLDQRWDEILGTMTVETPERSFDFMLNRWLQYQVLSCRLWARTAFYQSSGAYGFRDQLQDAMAMSIARPDITRAQILRAAARQFVEGDVQHWWHPPTGRGVRTRFSDDLLWLPYVVSHHLRVTGDDSLLDASAPFIEGPALAPGQMESYFAPQPSARAASIYEHCALTIDRSIAEGPHGLPLIGCGDWNDGMNLVGIEGRGESIWLGWFLHAILERWVPLADARGDGVRAERWRGRMTTLVEALERDGWDGEWYRRAYFDDGTPLGSSRNDECQIDAIAQSWSVIAGAASEGRQRQAMASLMRRLVRADDGLVLLLTPPFDQTALEPGYIKGYLPGIRENGAQYTHAAAWAVIAQAMLGNGDEALALFQLINPVEHGRTADGAARYMAEPYALAGDVYSTAPHVGRGGWSWYSGSAAWLYRAGIESILGFDRRGDRLIIDPCIPRTWRQFTITHRHGTSTYRIVVLNPNGTTRGVASIAVDGVTQRAGHIDLADDGRVHDVQVTMGN